MKMGKSFLMVLICAFVAGVCTMAWAAEMVNINTATADELMKLEKIGPAKAAEIIKYRTEKGPFASPEDLKKVKGIGDSIFELNKARIVTDLPKTETDVKKQAADAAKKMPAPLDSSVSPPAADIKAGQKKAEDTVKKTQTNMESSIPPVTDTKKK